MIKHVIPAAFVLAASVGAAQAVAVNSGDTVCEGPEANLALDGGSCTTAIGNLSESVTPLELNFTSGMAFLEGYVSNADNDVATLTGSGKYKIDLFADFSGSKPFDSTFSLTQNGTELFAGLVRTNQVSSLGPVMVDLDLGDVTYSFDAGDGAFNSAQSSYQSVIMAAAIPLPAAGLMLLGGLGAMGAIRRRKKAA